MQISRVVFLLGITTITLISLRTNAAKPPAIFKDKAGRIYVHSQVSPKSKLKVTLVGEPFRKTIKAGACGQVAFGSSTSMPSVGSSISIAGTTIDLTTITTPNQIPKCTKGAYSPAATSNFLTATGRYELIGYTPGQSYSVLFNGVDNHFNVTVNGCGFAVIKSTPNRPLTAQITINGAAYNVANLTVAEPPICKKSGGARTLYTPASWEF